MVVPSNAKLMAMGDEILTKLRGFAEGKLEQLFEQLLERAENFRKKHEYRDAENRCQRALGWARDPSWSSKSALGTDLMYAEGTARVYLGVVLLSQGHLKDAGEYFQEAARVFSQNSKPASAGVAYMALGLAYELRSDWDNAITAYQQSLNELNRQPSSDPLKIQVADFLQKAVRQLDCCPNGGPGIPDAVKVRCIPVIGNVSSGIIGPPRQDGFIALDGDHCGEASFALRVFGNGMTLAGIKDGDYVFIKEEGSVTNGQRAVLKVSSPSEKVTFFKRYYEEMDHLRLEPDDDGHTTIVILDPHIMDRDDIVGRYASRSGKLDVICPANGAVVEGLLVALLSIGDR